MDLGIAGKVALVTASSKGLGRASALSLARDGAKVVITARGEEALAATAADIDEVGAEVLAVVDDVTDPEAPARLVATTVEHFGSVDVLVANAGGPPPARALEVDDESLTAALNANLLTSIRLVQEAVPHMRSAGWGRICLITSSFVKQPSPVLALSNTARTGLWAWSKTAAMDLAGDGITLNLACPGLHDTDRTKGMQGRKGDPADFGDVVAFLCSEPAKFVTGAALQVDGGAIQGLL